MKGRWEKGVIRGRGEGCYERKMGVEECDWGVVRKE